ncbi:DUF397 domain-containing protein [Streptomyces sp. H27-D2]|uniref:DUF397 domain-containing protein n=1 Tax=Streptomyces sp. H27-D2 TaxID=3046304 RepID=UPI002DBD6D30|nr:DUF397 domain-containing protein [Streptomyces sp. H27-D2]MEC4015710.1 DUF397 domain-containing protein [Streptomyces sp. H27-D2]
MIDLIWQKSSFSGSGQDDCVEVATDPAGRIHFRESDAPATVGVTTRPAWAALLARVRAGDFDGLTTVADGAVRWQKSSYSSGDGNSDRVEVATDPVGRIHFRESDAPATVGVTTRPVWAAFVAGVKAGDFDHFATGGPDGARE